MIVSKLLNSKYIDKEDLVGGLVWGLGWGLAGGLVWDLVVMLVNFPEAFPFLLTISPVLFLILGFIVLVEFLFLLDNSKPKKKDNKLWFTVKRKLEAGFEVLLGLSAIGQVYILSRELGIYWEDITKWIGYIGVGIIVLGIIVLIGYGWIRLNSLRYTQSRGKTRNIIRII